MRQTKIKYPEQRAFPSPYKLLWLFALIIPVVNTFLFGSLSIALDYYGNYYGAFTVGTVLLLFSEITGTLCALIKYLSFLSVIMILGFVATKKSASSCIGGILLFVFSQFVNLATAVLSFSLLYALDISDSTGTLMMQLRPLVLGSTGEILTASLFLAIALLIFALVRKKSRNTHPFAHFKTPYMITLYVVVSLYSAFLFLSPLSVLFKSFGQGDFREYLLPFLYALLYSGAMFYYAVLFSKKLEKYFEE